MSKQEEIKQALAAATPGERKDMALELIGERDHWRSEFHKLFSQRERALEENERLRKELEEAKKVSERYRFALNEINDAKGEFSGVVCRVIARKALGQEGEGNQ